VYVYVCEEREGGRIVKFQMRDNREDIKAHVTRSKQVIVYASRSFRGSENMLTKNSCLNSSGHPILWQQSMDLGEGRGAASVSMSFGGWDSGDRF
jgi:hypothetical protein